MSGFLWLALAAVVVAYRVYIIIYNVYFHPLAKVPGPKLYAISWFPRLWYQQVKGTHYRDLKDLHEKYGVTVRIGPDEVSNASSQGWDDICGSRTFVRDLAFLQVTQLQKHGGFISPVKSEHQFVRRLLQPAFTDKALHRHEGILIQWTNIMKLNMQRGNGQTFDLSQKLVWTTFDMMGMLSFGKSFGCLENNKHHPYLKAIELGAPFLSMLQIILRFDLTKSLYDIALKLPWMKAWNSLAATAKLRAADWIENADEERGDLMSVIYKAMLNEKTPLSKAQADDMASILCLAGAESTPVLMAGMCWWVLSTPHVHARLVEEVRRSIETADGIIPANVSKLPFLDACVTESLRLHTPFSVAIPRLVPEGGAFVEGHFLPEGTVCGVPHWASAQLSYNFTEADKFLPERWLPEGKERFANDKKDSFKPFAKGSLDCIGQRLVWAEVRMVMATLFWHFDLELQPESRIWATGNNTTVRMMREKRPLYVKATLARE